MIILVIFSASVCIMMTAELTWKSESPLWSAMFANLVFLVGIIVGLLIRL